MIPIMYMLTKMAPKLPSRMKTPRFCFEQIAESKKYSPIAVYEELNSSNLGVRSRSIYSSVWEHQ